MGIEQITNIFAEISLNTIDISYIIAIVIAALLLVVSAFASGSEIAFFSLTPNDLNELDCEKNESDRQIKLLRDDGERTLATILITNNFVNVTIIMLLNYAFSNIFNFGNAIILEFLCITVLLTFLLLLFGEIMPKIFGRQDSLKFCRRFYIVVIIFRKLFWPIENILLSSGSLAGKLFSKSKYQLSVDELEHALELTDQNEIKEEQKMLRDIIRFSDETVKNVMTIRQDIIDLDIKSSFTNVLQCILENNYSRIPIYQENIDNIRGILYIKDLLPHIEKPANFRWQSLIRPPYFVPETKKLDELLKEFQTNRVHIAIVVDEFGGTSGIITLEDILEEIVGEINDEFDDEESQYIKINENTFILEGKTQLSDLLKILSLDVDIFEEVKGEADSLAGLILEIKGDFPKLKEQIIYKNFTFQILNIEDRRISKVKVTIKNTL